MMNWLYFSKKNWGLCSFSLVSESISLLVHGNRKEVNTVIGRFLEKNKEKWIDTV